MWIMFSLQEALLSLMRMGPSLISKPLIKKNVLETTKFELPFRGFTKTAHPKVRLLAFDAVFWLHWKMVNCESGVVFQEFTEALKKLREVYFANKTNVGEIIRANAHLLSDSGYNYGILKAAAFQSAANGKATSGTGRKNTFLFRLKSYKM